MNKKIHSMWPSVRQDFNQSVDRRRESRQELEDELYFRDVSANNDAKMGFFDGSLKRN